MPIYEFHCPSCDHRFETLCRSGEQPRCPHCGHATPRRLISLFRTAGAGAGDCSGCSRTSCHGCH